MNIAVIGINYKKTPLEIREKFSFTDDEKIDVINNLMNLDIVEECVVLSTCNRTEVYICGNFIESDLSSIEKIFCDVKQETTYRIKKYFYVYMGRNAAKHLLRVCCGLDSMLIGEDQILGQVKTAHHLSLQKGTSGNVLNTLFRDAITAAKEVKTTTELSQNSVSIGALAVKRIEEMFAGDLNEKTAMIIGTGQMGANVFCHLCSKNIKEIYLTNRSHGKAEELIKTDSCASTILYENRYEYMNECDIVISSTTSPHYTITMDLLETVLKDKKKRVFVDLAVPRDIDIAIVDIEGVHYIHMDQLEADKENNIGLKHIEAEKADNIIEHYLMEFEKWYEFRQSLPLVREIQKYVEDFSKKNAEIALKRLKSLSAEDKEIYQQFIYQMVNELMNKLVYGIKENANKDEISIYLSCLSEIIRENS